MDLENFYCNFFLSPLFKVEGKSLQDVKKKHMSKKIFFYGTIFFSDCKYWIVQGIWIFSGILENFAKNVIDYF
jgi:hypothetical protein